MFIVQKSDDFWYNVLYKRRGAEARADRALALRAGPLWARRAARLQWPRGVPAVPIAVVIVVRFVQIIAALGVWIGMSFGPSLLEYVSAMAHGQPWETGELAMRIA